MALDYILNNTGPEVQERLDQVPVTQAQLTEEIANREDADAAETQAREAADAALQDSIGAEATRAEGAEQSLDRRITDVEGKIPQGATPQNPLADKEWVTGSIATATADFITASVNDLVNYYLKSETYTKAEVQQIIDSIKQFNYQSVPELPTASAATTGIIYLVPSADPQSGNVKDEYITVYQTNEMGVTYYSWEQIGSTAIDLADYYTKSQTDAAITADLNTALASYSTTSQMNTAIETAIANLDLSDTYETKGAAAAVVGDAGADYNTLAKIQGKLEPIEGEVGDKPYVEGSGNGMGRIVLKKGVAFAGQFTQTNTIYVIQDDFGMDGGTLTIPANCTLKFEGGSISGGTINFGNTLIDADYDTQIFGNIEFTGLSKVSVKWFGAKGDGVTDDTNVFRKLLNTGRTSVNGGYFEVFVPFGTYVVTDCINENANSQDSNISRLCLQNILIGEGEARSVNQAYIPESHGLLKASIIYCKGELTTKPFVYGLCQISHICFMGEVGVDSEHADDYSKTRYSKYSTTQCLQIGNATTWTNGRKLEDVVIEFFGLGLKQTNNYGSNMDKVTVRRCYEGVIMEGSQDKYITSQVINKMTIEFCQGRGLYINYPDANSVNNLKFKDLCVQFCDLDNIDDAVNSQGHIKTVESTSTGTSIDGLYIEMWDGPSHSWTCVLCDFATINLNNAHLLKGTYKFGERSCVKNVSQATNSLAAFSSDGLLIKAGFGKVTGNRVEIVDSNMPTIGRIETGPRVLRVPSNFTASGWKESYNEEPDEQHPRRCPMPNAPLTYIIGGGGRNVIWGKADNAEFEIPTRLGQIESIALTEGFNHNDTLSYSASGRLYRGNGNTWKAIDAMGRTMSNTSGVEIPLYGSTNPSGLNNTTDVGFCFYNTTLMMPVYWTGDVTKGDSGWVDVGGSAPTAKKVGLITQRPAVLSLAHGFQYVVTQAFTATVSGQSVQCPEGLYVFVKAISSWTVPDGGIIADVDFPARAD